MPACPQNDGEVEVAGDGHGTAAAAPVFLQTKESVSELELGTGKLMKQDWGAKEVGFGSNLHGKI